MTEIPEHLLKRSKERRAALGLPGGEGGSGDGGSGDGGGSGGGDAPPAEVAKAAPAAAPAQVEEKPPPPPKPKAAYIQAAENRKRIPFWAMPVIALLPVWAFLYSEGISPPPNTDEGIAIGEEVYGSCANCHGPTGGGGVGAQLNEGEVLKTYPDPVAMMEWIHLGAVEWTGTSGAAPYGDPNRDGGQQDTATKTGEMPGFGDLDAEELAGVTRYVREDLAGEAPASPEVQELYHEWAETAIENAENEEVMYRDIQPADDPDYEERVTLVGEGAG
ncbi:MAG TPA: c-type cytochrome [Iamia sp.]|nr:c-type cytochrome [Iamia sp.]